MLGRAAGWGSSDDLYVLNLGTTWAWACLGRLTYLLNYSSDVGLIQFHPPTVRTATETGDPIFRSPSVYLSRRSPQSLTSLRSPAPSKGPRGRKQYQLRGDATVEEASWRTRQELSTRGHPGGSDLYLEFP